MTRHPPRSTRTATLFPYTTLFRSEDCGGCSKGGIAPFVMPDLFRHPRRYRANRFLDERHRLGSRWTPEPVRGDGLWCFCLHSRLRQPRSEEHTSELQSLMRISNAVFC